MHNSEHISEHNERSHVGGFFFLFFFFYLEKDVA